MKAPVKVLATALILASTSGLAFAKNYKGEANYKDMPPPCPPPAMLKDGFYLGAQVGYDSYRVRTSITDPNGSSLSANPVQNVSSAVGGLFLGYGQYLTDLFYLGGEIFGTLNNGSQTMTASTATLGSFSSKFETNNAYGLALLPGLRLNDTSLGYIRLGYNWANLKGSDTLTTAAGVTGSTSKSNTSGGFNLGLGIETLIVTNWSVRGEFSHTWYNDFTTNFGTKYSPSDNLFMLGLLYHFS
jgi:outer membrane immunogenic protein